MCGAEGASIGSKTATTTSLPATQTHVTAWCMVSFIACSLCTLQEWDDYPDDIIFYHEDDEFERASVDQKDDASIFKLKGGDVNSVLSQLMDQL